MDLKAVQNAIAMDTSNGIVEGYVNKLKAVKRTMYGPLEEENGVQRRGRTGRMRARIMPRFATTTATN